MSEQHPVSAPEPVETEPNAPVIPASLEEQVIDTLKTVYDPEIPVNIHELGLIYNLHVDPTGDVEIAMTLTSPNCPVAGSMPQEVKERVAALPGVREVKVDLVWDPPWDKDRMSEAAKLELGFF